MKKLANKAVKYILLNIIYNNLGSLRDEIYILDILVYLIRWLVHPAKLLEVFFNERFNLLKRLSIAQPFPFNQLIEERLCEMRQKARD